MVTILGTGHVFNLRERVQSEIYRRAPTAVAIELDPPRFRALQTPKEKRGKSPFFYQILADFQARIAEAYGVEAGDEMLAAAEAARNLNVPLALIDRDAQVTFRRLLAEMKFGEKARLALSVVGSLFVPSKSVESQVAEMEKDYTSYFEELGRRFPTVKRVLLDERNEHMAAAIRRIAPDHPSLVVVMGDGHVDGVRAILETHGVPVEALRLRDLRHAPALPAGSNASVTVSFDARNE